MRQRDIQVIVRSRLRSEYGIHGPPAIDVDFQAILFEECNKVGDVLPSHSCSLAAVVNR